MLSGKGVEVDMKEAQAWFELAAGRGDVRSQFNLALLLESTATDETQWKDAFHWYEKASERGDARSHFRLARLYADGKGVATNQTKASEHFLIAAEKGDPRAQAEAGMRCLEGVGVDKDPGKGLVLLEQAAEREDPMALYNLATLQEKQDRPEQREQTLTLLYQGCRARGASGSNQVDSIFIAMTRGIPRKPMNS